MTSARKFAPRCGGGRAGTGSCSWWGTDQLVMELSATLRNAALDSQCLPCAVAGLGCSHDSMLHAACTAVLLPYTSILLHVLPPVQYAEFMQHALPPAEYRALLPSMEVGAGLQPAPLSSAVH